VGRVQGRKDHHTVSLHQLALITVCQTILHFVRKVASSNPLNAGLMVVHYSAEVGRTGTFLTIFSQLRRLKAESNVGMFGYVQSMRYRRCYMVQTEVSFCVLKMPQ